MRTPHIPEGVTITTDLSSPSYDGVPRVRIQYTSATDAYEVDSYLFGCWCCDYESISTLLWELACRCDDQELFEFYSKVKAWEVESYPEKEG